MTTPVIIIITPPPTDPQIAAEPDGFAQALNSVSAGEEAKRLIDEAVAAGGSVRIVNT